MKGLVVSEEVVDIDDDWAHGNLYQELRIIVPGANNLVILEYHDEVIATFLSNEIPEGRKVLATVEVPEELILKAQQFVRAKIELNKIRHIFEYLIEKGKK